MIDLSGNVIAYYHMNESAWPGAGDVIDSGPNNHHGTAAGGASPVAGGIQGSNAGGFPGTSDYVDLPDITQIDGVNEVSVSVWLRANGVISEDAYCVDRWSSQFIIYGDNATYDCWRCLIRNTVNIYGNPPDVDDDSVIVPVQWQHVVFRYKRNEFFRMYVDNVEIVEQATSDHAVAAATGIVRLGADRDDGNARELAGKMDELLILDKALTPAEVAWLYNDGDGRESLKEVGVPIFQRYYRNRRVA